MGHIEGKWRRKLLVMSSLLNKNDPMCFYLSLNHISKSLAFIKSLYNSHRFCYYRVPQMQNNNILKIENQELKISLAQYIT